MSRRLTEWQDGSIKLACTAAILDLRARLPNLFDQGGYDAVTVEGSSADPFCAFVRAHLGQAMVVVARRFPTRDVMQSPEDATIQLPKVQGGVWRDALTGQEVEGDGKLELARLLRDLPAAVLVGKLDEIRS